jgi:hypothetical protein
MEIFTAETPRNVVLSTGAILVCRRRITTPTPQNRPDSPSDSALFPHFRPVTAKIEHGCYFALAARANGFHPESKQ